MSGVNEFGFLKNIIKKINQKNAKAFMVGGWVLDELMGKKSKDIDIEIYKISYGELEALLSDFGKTSLVGKSYGIIKLSYNGYDLDFNIPRNDRSIGIGHKDFEIITDINMEPKEAARRRDFTINSMYRELYVDENDEIKLSPIIDHFNGLDDFNNGVLRATDTNTFVEDPLRALRAMQLVARKSKVVEKDTLKLCSELKDALALEPKERLFEEFNKLMLKAPQPSVGIRFLVDTGLIDLFPEIKNLIDCPQNPLWHPEGWSYKFVPFSSISLNTCMTKSIDINYSSFGLKLREIFSSPPTLNTFIEGSSETFRTQSVMGFGINSFSTAFTTGSDSVFLSSEPSIAIHTKSNSLMSNITPSTISTDKGIWVMFKISISSMKRIMDTCIDNFQILDSIIKPITIFMMNMFSSGKLSTDYTFHYNPMKPNGSISIGPTDVIVSSMFADTSSIITDGYITFFSNIFINDFNHNIPPELYDNTRNLLCQIKIGDVFEHSMRAIDFAAMARDEGLIPEGWELAFMYGCLLHDVGKPEVTCYKTLKAHGHPDAGEKHAISFMERLTNEVDLIDKVLKIVVNHMRANSLFDRRSKAKGSAWKRLHNCLRLDIAGLMGKVDICASSLTEEWSNDHPVYNHCLEKMSTFGTVNKIPYVLMGRHLIERGHKPGIEFKSMLDKAYNYQIDFDCEDIETLYKVAISED